MIRPATRHRALAALAAASLALSLADLARSQIEDFLIFDCATFGTADCAREIPDFEPLSFFNFPIRIPLEVPGSACEIARAVGVRMHIEHTWVGDLQVSLTQGSTNRTVHLIDRPGVDALGDYGCSGHGIDVRIHDDVEADGGADYTCDVTIPAIGGDKTSSLFGRRLVIEPDDPPSFGDCDFERFDGVLLPSFNSTVVDGACAPFTKPGNSVCEFRGRYNRGCGGEVTVQMVRDGDEMTLNILDELARFRATTRGPTRASLTQFEIKETVAATGSVFLEDTGLSHFAGTPCAGTWTLTIADRSAPNVGRVTGWSLLLLPEPSATPTPLDSATPQATPTHTASGVPATRTPTDATPAPPTATPNETQPTAPATSTPAQTAATATATADATPGVCVGDCNGDGTVAINELILGVRIALGMSSLDACPSFDADGDGEVEINELVTAVNNALSGCR